jgi:transcriptional regulator with XRE-family HTH domain
MTNSLLADVRERRLAVGISQEKLGRLAECSTGSVRLIERGYQPSNAMAERIDAALSAVEAERGVTP